MGTAPSWKPLPVLFTTPFSFAGEAAPALWLVVSRTGALLALAMAARLAARWSPGRLRWLAGCTAAAGLLLVHEYLRRSAVGNVEPLMVAFGLLAIERHLDGHRRQALALGALAALVRPEIWPFLGAYCVHLWFADRRARALIVSAISLIALLWFGGALWGSGDAFQSSHVVLTPGRPTPRRADPAPRPPCVHRVRRDAAAAGHPAGRARARALAPAAVAGARADSARGRRGRARG